MMQADNPSMKSKANIIAAVIIIAVVLGVFSLVNALSDVAEGSELIAIVHDGDGEVYELSLAEDTTLTIVASLGTNVIVVQNHEVHVSEADCDNQDCIHQGSLSSPGKQIICLPHKLWIEVVANGAAQGQMDTDAVNDAAPEEAYDSVSR